MIWREMNWGERFYFIYWLKERKEKKKIIIIIISLLIASTPSYYSSSSSFPIKDNPSVASLPHHCSSSTIFVHRHVSPSLWSRSISISLFAWSRLSLRHSPSSDCFSFASFVLSGKPVIGFHFLLVVVVWVSPPHDVVNSPIGRSSHLSVKFPKIKSAFSCVSHCYLSLC